MTTPETPISADGAHHRFASHTILAVLVVLSGVLWVGLAVIGFDRNLAVVGAVLTVVGIDRALEGRIARGDN